ncbi:hypothetical protein [Streptomyces sp. NPDC050504]|uniref:hypothetical protein n=1 Tax=Streptomyces sp. NPDC050504 TaxID=3365618 RepID=UPI00378F9755
MKQPNETRKRRFLVLHDYGMGGLWWWVWARSAEEVVENCAEVEVVTDPDALARAGTWSLDEVHIDAPHPNPLSDLRAQREAQRDQPGFGALVGRELVHLRWLEDGDDQVCLLELGPDGRKVREVEIGPDGDAVRTGVDDWLFNPPFDLFDPQYAPMEISRAAFDEAWRTARHEPQE